jgi:ATP-dependent Zn protease
MELAKLLQESADCAGRGFQAGLGEQWEDVTVPPSRRRTAWHEAGHAVVAWDQGFAVVLVSIRRVGNSFGRSTHTPAADCSIDSERHRENIVAMGGWAAEQASGEAGDRTYDDDDLQCLANRSPEDRLTIELGWAEQEAARIVRSNLDRVERLAGVLLERTELSDAAEIKAIVEG